ncbi:MAG: tetratricopeptide repeat protein, partial [Gemmataceae bacterium]
DAQAIYRRVLALQPDNAVARSRRLYLLNYDHRVSPVDLLEEHRGWARQFAAVAPADPTSFPNVREPDRRLRVGYVSPDFRRHPVGRFVEPILAEHNPNRVEVFCYDEAIRMPDDVTARLRSKSHHWRITRGFSHNRFAEQVRADGIDILVDLAGHTADNRLAVLARRLAPVQATWLGYPNSTGVPAIDYLFTDAVADPPDQPAWFTEQPMRLANGFCCFAPRDDAPPVSILPAERNGYLTLGAPHALGKINAAVMDLWAELLKAVPSARLVIARSTLGGSTREWLRHQFAARGVADDRLELRSLASGEGEYLGVYREVDVTLDPFPWTGHTTACESLWMGVPVVTLRGQTHAGRMVASVLTHAGLADWVADSPPAYVAVVKRWAANIVGLAKLRAGLREQVRWSKLCDARGVTRGLEAAFRDMWRRRCTGLVVSPAATIPPPSSTNGMATPVTTTTGGALGKAEQLFAERRLGPAEQVCRQMLSAAPNNPDGWRVLGDACKAQGKTDDAINAYRRALELQPGQARVHHSLGILFSGQKNPAAAEEQFRRAIALQPDHARGFNNLGHVLSELGRLPEAVTSYEQAERLGFRDGGMYLSWGLALIRQRQSPAAEAVFRRGILANPNDATAHFYLANTLTELNRPNDALDEYKKAEQLGKTDAAVYDGIAQTNARLGLYREALAPAAEAVRRKPDDPDLLKRLGHMLNKLAKFDESVNAYLKAIALRPDDADAHWRLAMVHTRQGFLDKAVERSKEAVRLQPDNPAIHSGLASAYIQNGDIDDALATLRHAIRLNPNYVEAYSS